MPQIEFAEAPRRQGSGYPPPYDEPCRDRRWLQLGEVVGLIQFGVDLVTLASGQASATGTQWKMSLLMC
jgi:uncharacterized cupin superfamily protein